MAVAVVVARSASLLTQLYFDLQCSSMLMMMAVEVSVGTVGVREDDNVLIDGKNGGGADQ